MTSDEPLASRDRRHYRASVCASHGAGALDNVAESLEAVDVRSKKRRLTKRARILTEVLDCINRDDYDYFDEYLICGGSFEDLLDAATDVSQKSDTEVVKRGGQILTGIREAVSDIHIKRGQRAVQRRTSLHKLSERPVIKGLDRLERANAGGIADSIRGALDVPQIPETASEELDRELDELDAAFAAEVLGRLPKMVDLAARLDEVDLPNVPQSTRAYFYEAHRCYLNGFQIACAVLCRAILESALKEVVDADRKIDKQVQNTQRKMGNREENRRLSYYKALVKAAKLPDDRPQCAMDVRKAGNAAIHNLTRFNMRWGGRLDEILLNTRKVLLDLFAGAAGCTR